MAEESVLVVEDEVPLCTTVCEFLSAKGIKPISARNCMEAEFLCRTQQPDAAILDYELPDGDGLQLMSRLRTMDSSLPVIFLTGHGSIQLAVEAVKQGADQFLTKPADLPTLLVVLQRSFLNQQTRRSELANKTRDHRVSLNPFIGESDVIKRLSELAHRVVKTNSPVLIQGETGSGKGILARWMHQNGGRSSRPFVDLNCGGLSQELLETELFGHEKGAFTGAVQAKLGLLEVGHKGTIFLDEIGDMHPQVQAKLLKVLEEKIFRRLGDVRERLVDIRLIAATHRKLRALISEQKFREDLYFRISTISLEVPPLRERISDIPALANRLLTRITSEVGVSPMEISSDAMSYLQAYSWPGNVRELRNILERAVLLGNQKELTPRDLHFESRTEDSRPSDSRIRTLEEVECAHISEVLRKLNGKVDIAAKRLGIPRSSLYFKIKQYHLLPDKQTTLKT